jgi:hypothetical protein
MADRITLPPMDRRRARLRILGDSPLIMHRWSDKARKAMFDKQTKRATNAREAKDPERDYQESIYRTAAGAPALPALAFKNAAVDACSQLSGITKVLARGAFHVVGEWVEIEGEPHLREDLVRVGMGTADLRYRAEFPVWACTLTVEYNADVISIEQLVNLFQHAGFAVGVAEWRPQRNGNNGMFHVTSVAGEEAA